MVAVVGVLACAVLAGSASADTLNGDSAGGYNNLLLISFRNVLFMPAVIFVLFLFLLFFLLVAEIFFHVDMEDDDTRKRHFLKRNQRQRNRRKMNSFGDIESPATPDSRPSGGARSPRRHRSEESPSGLRGESEVSGDNVPPGQSPGRSPAQRASARMSARAESRSSMGDVYGSGGPSAARDNTVEGANPMARRAVCTENADGYISGAPVGKATAIMLGPAGSHDYFDDGISSLSDPNIDSSIDSSTDEEEDMLAADLPTGTQDSGKLLDRQESDFYNERRKSHASQQPPSGEVRDSTPKKVSKSEAVKSRPNMVAGFTGNVVLSPKQRAVVKRPITKDDFIEDEESALPRSPSIEANHRRETHSGENMALISSILAAAAEDESREKARKQIAQQEKLMNTVFQPTESTESAAPLPAPGERTPPRRNSADVAASSPLARTPPRTEEEPVSPTSAMDPEESRASFSVAAASPVTNSNQMAARARPSMSAGFRGNVALSGSRRSVVKRPEGTPEPAEVEMASTPSATGHSGSDSDSVISMPNFKDEEELKQHVSPAFEEPPKTEVNVEEPQETEVPPEDESGKPVLGLEARTETAAHIEQQLFNRPSEIDTSASPTSTNPAPLQDTADPDVPPTPPSSWRRASISAAASPVTNPMAGRRASIASPGGSTSFDSVGSAPKRPPPASPRTPPEGAVPPSPSAWRRASIGSPSIGSIDENRVEVHALPRSPSIGREPIGSPPPVPARRPSRRPTDPPSPSQPQEDTPIQSAPVVQSEGTPVDDAEMSADGFYSLQALQKSVPPGVDARQKECFLSDADFQSVFGMDKAAFYALPKWKQTTLKKDHKLY